MTSIWGELKRRNVVKVAVAYAIVGWLLVQVADTFFPALRLPEWTVTFVAGLVILGLPLALILSWAYELTPDGVERTKSVPLSESIAKVTGRKLDFVIIGLMAVGIAFLVVDNYVLDSGGAFAGADVDPGSLDAASDEPPSTVAEPTPAIADEEQREVLPNSVAVLPFENVSPNPDDAYFATGIHEEILNQLAKLSALNVIARTSMRQYANTEKSIPEIAEELNVETVMEGSVRYAGGLVRITAQLNDGITGAHLWSETYTRDFEDIFAIESDVAMNVANALEAEFSLEEQERIERIPTDSPEAYAFYLRAVAGISPDRVADLEQALALDANFALAYALIARLHSGFVTFGVDVDILAEERLALENAGKALALDPDLGLAHIARADVHQTFWRWAEAREAFERAYQLSPSDAEVLAQYGRFKRNTGDYAEAIRVGARAVELDPVNANAINQLAVTHRFARDDEAAAQVFRRLVALFPVAIPQVYSSLGIVEATRGNNEEAVRNLRRAEELFGDDIPQLFRYAHLARGYGLAGEHEEAERVVAALEDRAREGSVGEAVWALAYIALGDYDEAFRRLEAAMAVPSAANYVTLLEIKANPWADPVLDEPRFREVLNALWSE